MTGFISFSVISQDSSMLLYVIVSRLVKAEEHSIVCIHYHILFIYLFIDGHLSCFYRLAYVNNAVLVCVFF